MDREIQQNSNLFKPLLPRRRRRKCDALYLFQIRILRKKAQI